MAERYKAVSAEQQEEKFSTVQAAFREAFRTFLTGEQIFHPGSSRQQDPLIGMIRLDQTLSINNEDIFHDAGGQRSAMRASAKQPGDPVAAAILDRKSEDYLIALLANAPEDESGRSIRYAVPLILGYLGGEQAQQALMARVTQMLEQPRPETRDAHYNDTDISHCLVALEMLGGWQSRHFLGSLVEPLMTGWSDAHKAEVREFIAQGSDAAKEIDWGRWTPRNSFDMEKAYPQTANRVFTAADALRMLQRGTCDGVYSGDPAGGNFMPVTVDPDNMLCLPPASLSIADILLEKHSGDVETGQRRAGGDLQR